MHITLYRFTNLTLNQKCSYNFVVRREHVNNHTLFRDIKENILGFSNWEIDDFVIGEPDDVTFPSVEIRGDNVILIPMSQDETVLTGYLDGMSIN